ncbi:MAG TPA: hypothetical protein VJU78_01705, partial [Chitinophagaceae bacterium]|nr:hypothetical protein [Chitinophagaceae bacterium]
KYNNKKILLGASATEFPSDLFSCYDLVQFYINKLPSEIKEIKLACVIAAEYSGIGKFWQTAANNRGFKCRAFTAVQQAEEWIVK